MGLCWAPEEQLLRYCFLAATIESSLDTVVIPVAKSFVRFEHLRAVIPAEAGIQSFQDVLDPGFRRGDGL